VALAPLAPAVDESSYEDTFSLRDYWRILVRRRTLILSVVGVMMVATGLFTLWQPTIYQSTATLMPLGASRSGLQAALGELGGVLPSSALPMGLGKENPTDRLVAVLQSRTVAMDVIQHLGLLPRLFEKQWDAERQQWRQSPPPTIQDAERLLRKMASITASRQGVITIAVEHTDPVLAAAIANSYLDVLQQALNDKAFSLAKKNRLFIAAQLEKTREDLDKAEEALKQFEQTHKIVSLKDQTAAAVKTSGALEEQIMIKEVQLGVQQRLLTGASREVYLLAEEVRGLRSQLARLQYSSPEASKATKTPAKAGEDDFWIAFNEAPEVKLHYARLEREAQVQGKLFILLAQQLEQAKIEEARDETAFQLLDRALPPDRKSKPQRALTVALATVVGTFIGVFLAFFRDALDTTVRSKEQVERLVGLPLLAAMPVLTPPGPASMPVSLPLHTPTTEAVRYLFTRLRHLNGQQRIQTVFLAGTAPDDDIAPLLIQLAMVAASTGEKTLLIDADFQYAMLHSLLHCQLAPGLAETLTTPEHWQQGIQHTSIKHLHLVAAGTVTPGTSATLDSLAFDTLLAYYKTAYDLILCTAPALPGYSDAAVLGSKADATCLVLTCGVSHLDLILEAKNALEAVHANVTGAILTDCYGATGTRPR
jgi:uncharacterized protein involved in exopolysaccharide biosynthesis/Mrp family chromosome partitioning ATPase